jgi:hypothetical protein
MGLSGVGMMVGASLAWIVLLGQAPAARPGTVLVDQLGAARYADRQAAAGALERLGRQALPALRTARAARDPEIRARAEKLIDTIEGALLTQPSLVTLNFHDRPLTEIAKAVGDQAGIKLALVPDNLTMWRTTRISLLAPAPVPFWKAIDRLCDAAHLQYNTAMHAYPTSGEPVLALYAGGAGPSGPTVDSGPFRISLVGIHFQRDVSFLPGAPGLPNRAGLLPPPAPLPPPMPPARVRPRPASPVTNEQFYVQVQVAAEPRLALSQDGPLRILDAVDDRGQSLAAPPQAGGLMLQRTAGYFGFTAGSVVQVQSPLSRPPQPGGSIRKLRGALPLSVTTRKPDPLVVPLAGASGKTFHNEDVTLGIQDVKVNPNTQQTSIELTIRPSGGAGGARADLAAQPDPIPFRRPDMNQQQLEIVDAKGRAVPWYHSSFDAEGARMTVTVAPHPHMNPPVEVRYYGLARATTEVRFEFDDLPMP